MKMQNTEMEFVSFEAQDVITTSGGGNWFTMSSFGTDWKPSTYGFQLINGNNMYQIVPCDGDRQFLDLGKDLIYQLVNVPSENNELTEGTYDEDYILYQAYVTAGIESSGKGTQITTWQGILDWIDLYHLDQ